MSFHPYLAFAGNGRDAFTRYQEIFGGEFVVLDWERRPPMPVRRRTRANGAPRRARRPATVAHGRRRAVGGKFDGRSAAVCNVRSTSRPKTSGCSRAGRRWRGSDAARPDVVLARLRDVHRPLGTPWMVVTNDPNMAMPTPTFLRRVRTDEGRTRRKKMDAAALDSP